MICRMVYVRCDRCGAIAGGTDDMEDDARKARRTARQLGFRRVPGSYGPGRDLCPTCASTEEGTNAD